MKIGEYEQMMSYLTRPESTTPIQPREDFAIGGGVIQGENLGTREGFAGPKLIKIGKDKGKYIVRYRDKKFGRREGQTGFNEGNTDPMTKKEADAFYEDLLSKKEAKKASGLKSKNVKVKNQAQQINTFVSDFIDQNLGKYGIKDYDKFEKELNEAFEKSGIEDAGSRKSKYKGFPNIATAESEVPFSKFDIGTINRSAETDTTGNYFKKLFYTGKLKTDDNFRNRVERYLDYQNTDKKFYGDGNPIDREVLKNKYADVLNDSEDIRFLLESKDVGEGKFRSGIIKQFFPEKADIYIKKKGSTGQAYKKNVAMIENFLTDKQVIDTLDGYPSIKSFMKGQSEQLKKIFDASELPDNLNFNTDHVEGIAEIAKLDNPDDVMRGLRNLIGMTKKRNLNLGWKGYSKKRKELTDKINDGIEPQKNLDELNKLTSESYPEVKNKKAYSLKNGVLSVTDNFKFLSNPETTFKQYFTELTSTPEGLKALKSQYKTSKGLKKLLLEDPNLRKNVVIDDLAETIPGVTTADKLGKPPATVEREMFEKATDRFKNQRGFISTELLGADKLAKAAKLYGPAAGKIAQITLRGASGVVPFETLLMGDMQQKGLSPKEMALDIGTVGIGTIFKDIKEKADYVKSKGLGDELQSAFRKQTVAQQARPTLGGAEGMFKEPTLTDDEQRALNMYNLDAQNIIDMRRQYQSGEYEEMDKAFGYEDPIMRSGAMNGGIMRLRFKDGNEIPVVTVEDKIDELISFYQDYLKQGGKMNFMTFAKKYIPKNFATGGRAGFADGPSDPSKRKFIKIMGGLASIPIVGKFFKPAAKIIEAVAPVIQKTFEGAPAHFINLYKKIKNLGEDVTKKSPTREKEVVTEYEDYRLTEDVATGETTIQRAKLDSDFDYYDETLAQETYMNYRPTKGQLDEATEAVPNEYIEDTSYIRTSGPSKGEIYDTVEGVPDDVIEEGTKFEDNFMDFKPKKKNDK